MPAKKGHKKAGGRQKGTPNKVTTAAKEAFAAAFDQIGGTNALAEWAHLNKTEFFKLYARLIPVELAGEIKQRIEVVDDVPPK
jgi:hypothetical protein